MFMMFNPANFVHNLYYMGYGMLGIFVVIGIIIGITYLLNAIFSGKKDDDDNDKKDD